MTPTFSICHTTIRLPNGWVEAHDSWLERCRAPQDVEYVLCTERPFAPEGQRPQWGKLTLTDCGGAGSCTAGWNRAAEVSSGRVLIVASDDCFPPRDWDVGLLAALPDLTGEWALDVGTPDNVDAPGLITFPIVTRAYYERPGRGGCGGRLLYPEYLSLGNDDDFTDYARRDGVVVDARHLKFEHRHWTRGTRARDEADAWSSGRSEVWEVRNRVLARRRAENFSR
jgi:hypothetical protein